MDRRQKAYKGEGGTIAQKRRELVGEDGYHVATAASARARRSRRGVVISGGAFDLPVTSRLGFDYNQPLEERVFVQILPILWANCELNSKIQFKISHPRV